jgi:hypothetical protein
VQINRARWACVIARETAVKHLYAGLALTLLSVEAWAAETDAAPTTQSDPVVVTATHTPQPLSETIQPCA